MKALERLYCAYLTFRKLYMIYRQVIGHYTHVWHIAFGGFCLISAINNIKSMCRLKFILGIQCGLGIKLIDALLPFKHIYCLESSSVAILLNGFI